MDGNVEIKTAEIPVNEYMSAFRDVSTFSECCRRCGNYGNLWSCPPFGFDSEACLSRWTTAFVVAARSEVPSGLLHKEMMDMFLRPLRKKLEKRMLELESRYGGLAFGFSGECHFAVTVPGILASHAVIQTWCGLRLRLSGLTSARLYVSFSAMNCSGTTAETLLGG